jgi:2-octaprenyl-6-methoxyphenol hydroxylase
MGARLSARVNGAGPTGALAALALAAAGWRVLLFDPLSRQRLLERQRAYAFTHSSRRLLQRLGLWEALAPHLIGFSQLHLVDGALDGSVDFSGADLGPLAAAAANPAARDPTRAAAVGWIGSHGPLMALLLERLEANPAIAVVLGGVASPPSPPGEGASFDLVVAADGADSPTRRHQGIGQWHHPYGQACLTAQVGLRGAAADQAWEILRPEGPFAVLPMGAGRHQLVWSAPAWRCRKLESLSDTAFLDALAGALPEALQPEVLFDRPRSFPVALQLAQRLHRGRTVLVGDSAHRCHPVGGQGLNLGWRDVQTLMDLAERASAGRLAPQRLGAAYGRRRWPDVLLTLGLTDLLVRLYSNRQPLLLPLRALALTGLRRSAGLRRLALGTMTRGPWPPTLGGSFAGAAIPNGLPAFSTPGEPW